MLLSSSIRCKVKVICRLLRIENTRLKLRYCRRRWGLGKFLLKISDTYIASLKGTLNKLIKLIQFFLLIFIKQISS